jgi:hypothetical protein
LSPRINERAASAFTPQMRTMEMETRAESMVLDQAENWSLLGLKFGALINLENSIFFSKIAVIETPNSIQTSAGPARIECTSINLRRREFITLFVIAGDPIARWTCRQPEPPGRHHYLACQPGQSCSAKFGGGGSGTSLSSATAQPDSSLAWRSRRRANRLRCGSGPAVAFCGETFLRRSVPPGL